MRETFIPINDIPTHVMAWGPWIEETFPRKEVILCITGNPGLVGYYSHFLSTVHEHVGSDVPVWTLGHAGHDEPPATSTRKVPPLKGNETAFDLDAQVRHKAAFIRTYVPADVKIHLIGHSIGAWMVLELLKLDDIRERVAHNYLLFPTIERMAETIPGRMLTQGILPWWWALRWAIMLFNVLPTFVAALLVSVYFWAVRIPLVYVGTTLKYLRLSVLSQILHLADDEMKRVCDPDVQTIARNCAKMKIYYGATDGWTPASYCEELKRLVPGLDAEICSRGVRHAFVLKSSAKMGRLVGEWIVERRSFV